MLNKIFPAYGMDLNSDPLFIKQGKTRFAKNVEFTSLDGGTSWSAEPSKGNTLKFAISIVQSANKIYHISPPANDWVDCSVQITGVNGVAIANATGGSFAAFITNLGTALTAASQTFTLTAVGDGTYTLEITTIPYFNYLLYAFGTTKVILSCIQEPITSYDSTGVTGIVGGFDLLQRLYVFSTQDSIAVIPDGLEFNNVTNSGGAALLQFPIAHGIPTGLYVGVVISQSPLYNGTYIALATDASHLKLMGSTYAGFDIGVIAQIIQRIGQIGRVDEQNNGVTTYTKLLSATTFNFSKLHQVDVCGQPSDNYDRLYYTDNYNTIQAFYCLYDAPLNGALAINGGLYDYDNLQQELTLWQVTSVEIGLNKQIDSGGALPSGNDRYSVSFISKSGVETNLCPLSNYINCYLDKFSNTNKVLGTRVVTPKINELIVSNIPVSVYDKIVLYNIHYDDGAVTALRVGEYKLTDGQDTALIQHIGTETSEEKNPGEIIFAKPIYDKAKNISILNNRLVLSNLSSSATFDLSAFTQTIQHRIMRKELTVINSLNSSKSVYTNPSTVHDSVGYMVYEDIAIGIVYEYYSGVESEVFWMDTIRIDDAATNAGNPTDNRRIAGGTWEATGNVLSNTAGDILYTPYIEINIPNTNYLVDGIPIRQLIKKIRIQRAVNNNPRVLGCGAAINVVTQTGAFPGNSFAAFDAGDSVFQYPYISNDPKNIQNPIAYPSVYNPNYRQLGYYDPAIIYGATDFEYNSGDTIAYNAHTTNKVNTNYKGTSDWSSIGSYALGTSGLGAFAVDRVLDIATGQEKILDNTGTLTGYTAHVGILDAGAGGFNSIVANYRHKLIRVTSNITIPANNAGMGYLYYIRPRTNQYGDLTKAKYVETHATLNLATTTTTANVKVSIFGGDTFTDYYYFKHRNETTPSKNFSIGGIITICQSRVNLAMRGRKSATQKLPFYDGLKSWANDNTVESVDYNLGYSIAANDRFYTNAADNPDTRGTSQYRTRFHWSPNNPEGSLIDNFRQFKPEMFRDEELRFGEIVHHSTDGQRLLSWQYRKFAVQYFDENNVLQTDNDINVVLGDGGVMPRRSQNITTIGCWNKWSILTGLSKGGNVIHAWINTETMQICRFGYDGVVPISDVQDIETYLQQFVKEYHAVDAPANGNGICGVYDARLKTFIWSFVGGNNPQTIAFDSTVRAFTKFYSFIPPIYLRFKNSYYTPNYIHTPSFVFIHDNNADYMNWYGGYLMDNGYIELIDNKNNDSTKLFVSLAITSLVKPYRVEFENETQESFLTTDEFVEEEGIWKSPIKCDSTGTGINNDSSLLFSNYLITRFIFEQGVKQRLLIVNQNSEIQQTPNI